MLESARNVEVVRDEAVAAARRAGRGDPDGTVA